MCESKDNKAVSITTTLPKNITSKLEQNGYVRVVCRLCGEPWLFPPKMASQFDSEHGFECAYCRRPRVSNACEAMCMED